MATIENKTSSIVNVDDNGVKVPLTYAELTAVIVDQKCAALAAQGGLTATEMASFIDMIKKIRASEDVVQLDDDEMAKVREWAAEHKWRMVHEDLVELSEMIAATAAPPLAAVPPSADGAAVPGGSPVPPEVIAAAEAPTQ